MQTVQQAADRLVTLVRAVECCSQTLRGAIDRLAAQFQLTTTQLSVLWACGESSEGTGQSHLAARIGISPAQASSLVEHLRRRGLLESRRAPDDRRRQNWILTAEGQQIVTDTADGFAALARQIEAHQPNEHALELCERLSQIAAAVVDNALCAAVDTFPRLHQVVGQGAATTEAVETARLNHVQPEVRR